jgi:ankyrin repeat protein
MKIHDRKIKPLLSVVTKPYRKLVSKLSNSREKRYMFSERDLRFAENAQSYTSQVPQAAKRVAPPVTKRADLEAKQEAAQLVKNREGNYNLYFDEYGNYKGEDKAMSLFYAARDGHTSEFALLQKIGLNVNGFSSTGDTPVHLAAGIKDLNVIKTLVKAGGDINAKSKNGFTPLDHALTSGNQDIIDFLQSKNAVRGKSNNHDDKKDIDKAFAVLGLPAGTTDVSLVNKAYKKLAVNLHPDKHPIEEQKKFTELFTSLGAAKGTVLKHLGAE